MDDLFATLPSIDARSTNAGDHAPLAERLRPASTADVFGQEHLTGPGMPVARMLDEARVGSIILWGPAGTGKTTIARLLASGLGIRHVKLSAIETGIADLKKTFAQARAGVAADGRPTLVFVDEIHRFNKAQQDAFLPSVESGTVMLVGATTENPSFEINGALLSRMRVLVTRPLDKTALRLVMRRAEETTGRLPLDDDARTALISSCGGDARHLLVQIEALQGLAGPDLDPDALSRTLSRRMASHDKAGDGHYDLASAFQKSVRGSDPHAALYWAARMVDAGEDMTFLFRRLLVMASEEVGAADPTALHAVVTARTAFDMLGAPEGLYALSQAIVHVACAPKSNAAYEAWGAATALARSTRGVPPPDRILNAPTRLMAAMGRKAGYVYDHDEAGAFSGQDFWPDAIGPHRLYAPNLRGMEERIATRLAHWDSLRDERRAEGRRARET